MTVIIIAKIMITGTTRVMSVRLVVIAATKAKANNFVLNIYHYYF